MTLLEGELWWADDAACKGQWNVIEFYPPLVINAPRDWDRKARQMCAECPVKAPCLSYALAHDEQGIWGGTDAAERVVLMRRRKSRPIPAQCKKGHSLAGDNIYLRPDTNGWSCKRCRSEAMMAHKVRQRQTDDEALVH